MKRLVKIAIVAAAGLPLLFWANVAVAAKDNPAPPLNAFQNKIGQVAGVPQGVQASPPTGTGATPPPAIENDIRDIQGPISIPYPWLWACYAGAGCLLLLIAWAVWRWIRNGRAFRTKSPHEIAFERLEKARALMRPEKANEFSVAVSGAIRTYIEDRFHLEITRHTTEEFMRRLATDRPATLSEYSEVLEDFLGHCDLAKFARYNLSVDQMKAMHRSAWEFVEKTIPCPEGETSVENSAADWEDLGAKGDFKDRSLLRRLWAKDHGLIPKKTIIPVGLSDGSALVTGGGS